MGATIPECLAMAEEAIGLVLECMQDHGGHRQHGHVTEGSDFVLWPDDPPQS